MTSIPRRTISYYVDSLYPKNAVLGGRPTVDPIHLMPRPTTTIAQVSNDRSQSSSVVLPPEPITILRHQWKWAAFSQFFFTFKHLFSMNDVTLSDIENDLVHGSSVALPRVMQRLLYTLTYDRKISPSNWQTVLQRQYLKRDPTASPFGCDLPRRNSSALRYRERTSSFPVCDDGRSTSGEAPRTPPLEPREYPPKTESVSTLCDEIEHGSGKAAADENSATSLTEPESAESHDMEDISTTDWTQLPMMAKLDSMHILTEWQFVNPMRLRSFMRSDDDTASWRIEPIGYDRRRNAYWLIGANRLWVQRPPPKPPKPQKLGPTPLKRKRTSMPVYSFPDTRNTRSTENRTPKRTKNEASITDSVTIPSTKPRAAKDKANLRLNLHARELAELTGRAPAFSQSTTKRSSSRRRAATPSGTNSRLTPIGTRMSARLRGQKPRSGGFERDDDEWQPVPVEWLNDEACQSDVDGTRPPFQVEGWKDKTSSDSRLDHLSKTGLESDLESISDLTEITESSDLGELMLDANVYGVTRDTCDAVVPEGSSTPSSVQMSPKTIPLEPTEEHKQSLGNHTFNGSEGATPEEFVEWETICVTLRDWEHVAEQFKNATHYAERTLYRVLVNDVVPVVTAELRDIERKNQLDRAMAHRKRSSRLLIRQFEKEKAQAAARKLAEEDERNSRARRLEARLKREETEREKRETAREARRREREEKEEREKMARDSTTVKDFEKEHPSNVSATGDLQTTAASQRHVASATKEYGMQGNLPTLISATSMKTDDWELDCEICHRRGVNIDDGTPMMSCGRCSRWQHIACHDHADLQAGRKRRNWDLVDFTCARCQSVASASHSQKVALESVNHSRFQKTVSDVPQSPKNGGSVYGVQDTSAGHPNLSTTNRILGRQNSSQSPSNIRLVGGHYAPENSQWGSYARNSSPTAISFSHYQPQRHSFSPTNGPSAEGQGNGYNYPDIRRSATRADNQSFQPDGQGYQVSHTRWDLTPPSDWLPYNHVAAQAQLNMNSNTLGASSHHDFRLSMHGRAQWLSPSSAPTFHLGGSSDASHQARPPYQT